MKVAIALIVILSIAACVYASDCNANKATDCYNTYISCSSDAKNAACSCYGALMKCWKNAKCLTGDQYTSVKKQCTDAGCTSSQCADASAILPHIFSVIAVAMIALVAF